MGGDTELSETVVFEFLARGAAERLCKRLRPRWFVGLYDCDEIVLVAVELRPEGNDLAVLLNDVKGWAEEAEIAALRFHLDGREYLLETGAPVWRAVA